MSRTLLGLVFVAAWFGLDGRAADDEKKDADKLYGTWTATSWKRGPGEVGKDKVDTELVLAKDGYQYPKGINRISAAGTITVNPAKGEIDFVPGDGPAKGKTLLGRYKVDGDTLTLCFASAGNDRPAGLKSDDRNTVLATYTRKK